MENEKQHFFDKPENVTLVLRIFYASCIILIVLDFALYRKVYMSWESLPLFYPLYGFVACVVLVLIAREMRKVLMRDETHYGDDPIIEESDVKGGDHVDH